MSALDTFAKVRALHDGTTNPGEKAAAAGRMKALARKAGMTVKQAKAKLDTPQPTIVASATFDSASSFTSAFSDFFNTPEFRARDAERTRERMAKCERLLKHYGTEDAVFADTEREAALRKACEPLTVWDTRPDWSGCYTIVGWGNHAGKKDMPAGLREAMTKGWPWPETVAAAWSEYEASETLDSDRCAFEPGYTPHRWVEARRYLLEDVLDALPARSLNDLRARLSWMEHLSSLECQWTHEGDRTRLSTLRADIERMGARLRTDSAPPAGEAMDPIFAVLEAANTAETAHTLACDDLDEGDDAAMRGCNAACDGAAAARREVMRTLPVTVGGLRALACHYVRWGETFAEDGFLHIARTLDGCDSTAALRMSGGTP